MATKVSKKSVPASDDAPVKVTKSAAKPAAKPEAAKPAAKPVTAKPSAKPAGKTESAKAATKTEKSKEDKEAKNAGRKKILNPKTGKEVYEDSATGQAILKALEDGVEYTGKPTRCEELVKYLNVVQTKQELNDDEMAVMFRDLKDDFPSGFPVKWGGKEVKSTTKKHPEYPKPATTAFLLYSKAMINAYPFESNITHQEKSAILGRSFNELSEEDRQEYIVLAEEDKKRFEKELEKFYLKYPEEKPSKDKSSKKSSAKELPKVSSSKQVAKPVKKAPVVEEEPEVLDDDSEEEEEEEDSDN